MRTLGLDRVRDIAAEQTPVLVYMNHASWWDPMVSYLLSEALPQRRHFAPMDAAALKKYAILGRLGVFPVELASARGGAQFIRVGEAILRSNGVLWVTPQGRFADVRERPLQFKPGLARLALRVSGCTCVPLAIEYSFWNEKSPEILLEFGSPLRLEATTAVQAEEQLRRALDETMNDLARRVRTRDARQFSEVLLTGRAGVGGFYQFGQRVLSWLLRRAYDPHHMQQEEAGDAVRPGPAC